MPVPPQSEEGGGIAKGFTAVLGGVLVVIGLWGTISGGHDHRLMAFGINASHNLVHLLSGAVALVAAGRLRSAQIYCLAFGTIYGLVAIAGFFRIELVVRLLNLNMADNFLHLGIAAACLMVGGFTKGPAPTTGSSAPRAA
jgi:hypothetical protein